MTWIVYAHQLPANAPGPIVRLSDGTVRQCPATPYRRTVYGWGDRNGKAYCWRDGVDRRRKWLRMDGITMRIVWRKNV